MIPDGTSCDFASERFEAKSEETAGMILLDLGFRFGTVRGEVWTPESHGDSLSLRFANCNPNEPLTLNSAVG